jgi:hypothetical protein
MQAIAAMADPNGVDDVQCDLHSPLTPATPTYWSEAGKPRYGAFTSVFTREGRDARKALKRSAAAAAGGIQGERRAPDARPAP